MNKLLRAAIGAALTVGPAMVLAADDGGSDASDTVVLNLHFSLDHAKNGTTERSFLSSNDSKLTFKGQKDAGGGAKVIYQLVTAALFADSGTSSNLAGTLQDTYAGVQDTWG